MELQQAIKNKTATLCRDQTLVDVPWRALAIAVRPQISKKFGGPARFRGGAHQNRCQSRVGARHPQPGTAAAETKC
jgi:hypothetical protein